MAVEKVGDGKGYYLNLATEIKKQRQNTTAYTAATTLIIGLRAVLEMIEQEGGLEELYDATRLRASATREALEAIGLQLYPKIPAPSMSTVIDPDASAIRTLLKEYNVNVAGGQDHLKGKIFRINQMGLIAPSDAAWVLNSVELALERLDRRPYDGTAAKVFNAIYYRNEA
jgi:aspartate aminotransferase-like enzyme